MPSSATDGPTSAAAPPRPPHSAMMTHKDNDLAHNSSLENSLDRRRNTYTTLPGLTGSKSLLPEEHGTTSNGSKNIAQSARFANAGRRNTMPGIDCHTPPPSTTNSMDKAMVTTHAASEPRHPSSGRLALNPNAVATGVPFTTTTSLPPVASASSTLTAGRAATAGVARTNAAITRSARLPLGPSASPSSSAASTPPARKSSSNWIGSGLQPSPPVTNTAATGSSPASTSPSSSSSRLGAAADRVNLVAGALFKAGPSPPRTTTTTATTTTNATTPARHVTPPQEREAKKISTAIQSFNQRVLEENERAQSSRRSNRSSRANSRDTSISAIAVPSTQPPSAGPSPLLRPAAPPAEPPQKRSPPGSTTINRFPNVSSARAPPPLVGKPAAAQPPHSPTPSITISSTSASKTTNGTGPKPTPADSSPVPLTLKTKLTGGAAPPPPTASQPPSRSLSGSAGTTSAARTVNAYNSSMSTPTTHTTPRASAAASLPRSTRNSADGGAGSSSNPVSLGDQGSRSGLPRSVPTPSNHSPPQQPSVKTLVQVFSTPSRLSGTPNASTSTTPRTSTSQSGRLVLTKSPPQQEGPPSVVNSGSSLASKTSPHPPPPPPPPPPPTTTSTKKTTPPTALRLPSRYSDYNEEGNSTTPPRVSPSTQALVSPVYSAVEVQPPTPPMSNSSSARRGLPSFASVFGDAKKDSASATAANAATTPEGSADTSPSTSAKARGGNKNTPNGGKSSSSYNNNRSGGGGGSTSPTPPTTQQKTALSGIVRSYTLDDLDDADGAHRSTANHHKSSGGHTGHLSAAGGHAGKDIAPTSDNASLDSNAGEANSRAHTNDVQQRTPPARPHLGGSVANKGGLSPPAVKAASLPTTAPALPVTSPLTALAVFSSTDDVPAEKGGSQLNTSSKAAADPAPPPPPSSGSTGAPTKTSPNLNRTLTATKPSVPPQKAALQQPMVTPPSSTKPAVGAKITTPPSPTTTATTVPGITNSSRVKPITPTATTSPLSLVHPTSSSTAAGGGGAHPPPDSALTRNGRYAMSRSRDGQGPLGTGSDTFQPLSSTVRASGPDVEAETATLNTYLKEEELNLSMSTFNSVGLTLAQSLNLRVLNLKGSTISGEGLRGLANIPTLCSICVSHMRNLTTLIPLVTPTATDTRCAIEEIDAQFSNIANEGIKGLEKLRRLRRLDLSMTPVSEVTCLTSSVSLNDLYLTGTRVDNAGVAGLEKVPTLVTLNIARTKVTSVTQLAKSRSLQTFIFYSCQVNDAGFVGVAEMPRLATLDVSTTKIENLSVLQKSRSLQCIKAQWLSLKNCQDIIQERRTQMDGPPPGDSTVWRDTEAGFAGLAAISTLETLDLSFNTLRSVHSLCRSKSLKHLYLKRTRVENSGIGSIALLAATLETLVITNLTDSLDDEDDEHEFDSSTSGLLSLIGDIHMLYRLTTLDLSYTDVFDLRLLQNIPTLRELVIVETLVTVDGLRGIEKIASLEVLDISQTSILSLQFLVGGAPALKKILAKSNRNASGFVLGQVHKLPALEHLDLSDSIVEDVEMVPKKQWHLKELVWRWGERRDNKGLAPPLECWVTSPRLVGLRDMPCLTLLDLTNSRVHELSFLANAPCLKTLYLKLCKLLRNSSIQELGSLTALEVLQLSDNSHITDVTCLRSCRRLRELQLNNTRVNTKGLEGVMSLPEMKVLNITNTRAEDEAMNGGKTAEHSRMLEDSNLRDGSVMLENTATPAQFRLPRRRRVSFVANDGTDTSSKAP